jgi:HAD superfamily hydrolase (TIGR01509 family)
VNHEINGRIEFVYFDLGNVLISFDPEIASRNLADRFAVSVRLAHHALYSSGLQDRFEHGAVSREQYAGSLRRQLGRSESEMPTSGILDAISDMFTPIESMRGVLRSVRQRGYRVGLLSNTCDAHWDWIMRQKYAVTDFSFDATVLSFRVGAMKPNHAIYRAAETAASVPSDRILFLDDKPENVAAASSRNWKAVRCFGGQEAIGALQAFRVLGDSA